MLKALNCQLTLLVELPRSHKLSHISEIYKDSPATVGPSVDLAQIYNYLSSNHFEASSAFKNLTVGLAHRLFPYPLKVAQFITKGISAKNGRIVANDLRRLHFTPEG